MNIRKYLPVIAIAVLGCLIISVASAVYYSITVKSHGKIKGVGVGIYADENATIVVSEINWGMLEPGESKNVTVYVKNEGNVQVTLALTVESWVPSNAEDFITLSWNYDGTTFDVEEIRRLTLTLTVDSSITGITEFSFDIVISAEG